MLKIAAVAIFVAASSAVPALSPADVYVLRGTSYGHQFKITFQESKFEARGRKPFWLLLGDPKYPDSLYYRPAFRDRGRVKTIHGIDTGPDEAKKSALKFLARHSELSKITVEVDGKRWHVPWRFYNDLMKPNLNSPIHERINERPSISRDGNKLDVILNGSDAAGSYRVHWTFRRSGKHFRIVDAGC